MGDEIDSLLIEEDYYTFLNVSKTATNEEINNAYRRLSLIYHPDKHVDPTQKKWAEIIFNKTKKAYEVLTDPHKRAIYDSLGIQGLETDGWEIIQRTKTPMEIREEYERLAREREERRLLRSTNPKGTTSVSINATDLFSRYSDDYAEDEGGFPIIEVSSISVTHSVEAPITPKDTVTLSCNLLTQNGTGSGSMNVSTRRITSEKGWGELEFGFGNGPIVSLKAFRTLTRSIFYSGAGVMQFSPRGIRPSLVSTLAFQMDNSSVGYLTYRAGANSSMTTSIVRDSEHYHANVSLQFGVPHSFFSLSYTRKMLQGELKLRACIKLGTFGCLVEYGAEKRISQHSSLSGAVTVGVPTGVMLKVKLTRGSYTFIFPIHISEEILMAPIFYATIVPIVSWLTIKAVFIDPMNREKELREREKAKENNKTRIQEMHKEAKWAVELMKEMYKRITLEESKSKGLIILKAVYGKLPTDGQHHDLDIESNSENSPRSTLEVIDVTIPLQCLVKRSKLSLQESSKSQLPGFFDICLGEQKHLTVKYSYRDQLNLCTIEDADALVLPKRIIA